MPFLTVFTPAFNRANTLPRLYESLKKQSNKDFIWLIVDDGSSDNTAELINSWKQSEKEFEIRYVYKQNGGMHTAHNTAYENIDTELNICIDSDDMLAENAIELIAKKWEQVRTYGYAGLSAINSRERGLDLLDDLQRNSVDFYSTVRSAYLQNRQNMTSICKSANKTPSYDFDFDDEDFED